MLLQSALRHLTSISLFFTLAQSLTPAQWRNQSIYQIMTDRFALTSGSTTAPCDLNNYCGGTWQGIINHLDYIQNMGFTAIWISPVVQNVQGMTADGSSYHGYWADNIYAVNTHFGKATELVALANALHSRGMYLMVDVVTNHMGNIGPPSTVQYQNYVPFNDQSYFHPYCPIDWNNMTSVQVCWEGDMIVSLPDLRTETARVQNMFNAWIKQLVANYTIDGLRIDSVLEVNQGFWPSFQAAAGGIHALGEVFNGDPNVVCPYQNYLSGLLNYPAYFWITQAFQSTTGSMGNLVNGIKQMKSLCKDVTLLGSFLENQDNPRFQNLTSDQSLVRNAVTFSLLADGIPIIYQGQEQSFSGGVVPTNREALWPSNYSTSSPLYLYMQKLNTFRNWAISQSSAYVTTPSSPVYLDPQTILVRKGRVVGVYTNRGSAAASAGMTLSAANTGFKGLQSITDVISCKTVMTDMSGGLSVTITGGMPMVLYPTVNLIGSGICYK